MITLSDYLVVEMFRGRRPRLLWLKAWWVMLFSQDGRACVGLFRLSQAVHRAGWRRPAKSIEHYLIRRFGCTLHPNTKIGIGFRLPHPQGVVIGNHAIIGNNCTIYQQVTVGGAALGDWEGARNPSIDDGCILWAGCKVVGAVNIGEGAMVGANAVVTRDVPPRHVAKGIPARAEPLREQVLLPNL